MKKAAEQIVSHRKSILIFMLSAALLCAFLALKVSVNSDMTKYLPDDSVMKQGMDLLKEEFPDLTIPQTIRVMTENLPEEEEPAFLEKIKSLPDVSSAGLTAKKGNRALFTVGTALPYGSSKERALERALASLEILGGTVTVKNDETTGMDIPLSIFITAGLILLAVLFVLCPSWTEPFLFLAAIGIAIILNMGTNLLLGEIAKVTWSISAILQLVLSMDYSIILMTRYRQEKQRLEDSGAADNYREQAMAAALKNGFPSVAGSGFTTLIGLLTLVFMHFKIGMDLGLVLAKGVFLSMICVFTVLPALILAFDGLVEKTRKKVLTVRSAALARFAFRFRYFLLAGFVVLFGVSLYLQSLSDTSFSLNQEDPIAKIFTPDNPVVFLYSNEDEKAMAAIAEELQKDEKVTSVLGYVTTLGKQMTPQEMSDYLKQMLSGGYDSFASFLPEDAADLSFPDSGQLLNSLNPAAFQMVYALAGAHSAEDAPVGKDPGDSSGTETMSILELFEYMNQNLDNPLISRFLGEDLRETIKSTGSLMEQMVSLLKGPSHSLLMISTDYPVEDPETTAFIRSLKEKASRQLEGDYYLIGNSCMSEEMKDGFGSEFLLITLLTAASVFLVIMVTFRKILIPLILVLLVQCGVFLTIMTTWLLGYRMYYLAILIVQCILMGATVDYGILFTSYYREKRQTLSTADALRESYAGTTHTILTSSMFMVFGTGAIGFSPVDPTIAQICQSIALGAISATLLILFILPGILAALDRFVVKKSR